MAGDRLDSVLAPFRYLTLSIRPRPLAAGGRPWLIASWLAHAELPSSESLVQQTGWVSNAQLPDSMTHLRRASSGSLVQLLSWLAPRMTGVLGVPRVVTGLADPRTAGFLVSKVRLPRWLAHVRQPAAFFPYCILHCPPRGCPEVSTCDSRPVDPRATAVQVVKG